MISSASALLLTVIAAPAAPAAADITPVSLAVRPATVEIAGAPYDWTRQARGAAGAKLAEGTANCNTQMATTNHNGQTDNVPDCNFD